LHQQLLDEVEARERLEGEVRRAAVLEQVDRQRAALLRSVSHDLRTPLTAITAAATHLRSTVDGRDATQAELLDLVIDEAERLDRIVANLLTYSRLEVGALRPRLAGVDLEDLVGHSIVRTARLFPTAPPVVDIPCDLPPVLADATQIDQVLSNLLENAARHAPSEAPVDVSAREDGVFVRLAVRDHGPGLGADVRAHLFEPFDPQARGTGLGLAICRAFVDAHGGTIGASDEPDGGTSFWFTLPTCG
jgi:two-component system sensor histidine kinase KdpD